MNRRPFYLGAFLALSIGMSSSASGVGVPTRHTPRSSKVVSSIVPSAEAVRSKFKGFIGDARFEMELTRNGDELAGDYYYLKSGSANRLTLAGQIGQDGKFTLKETDSKGKVTGQFNGKWSEQSYDSGANLEGEWSKPGQKGEPLNFYAQEQLIYFSGVQLTTRETKQTLKPKNATFYAEYPELKGGPGVAGFNVLAKKMAMDALAGFRKDLAGMTAADIKQMSQMGMGNYIDVGYGIEYADDALVSVSFGESTFTGGAHPNHTTFTLNYDLKKGRALKLAELFKPGSKYLKLIAELAVRDLTGRKDPESGESRGLAIDIFADGAKPTAENYRNWNITKKGLMFTFPPYQVASYADGPQTVIIPYEQLKSILVANSPVAGM